MEVQRISSSSTMEVARSVIDKLDDTFENFESSALSMLSLSEQWRKLQSEFAVVEGSVAKSEKEVVAEEREVRGIVTTAEKLQKEVELRKQRVELQGKMTIERVREEADEVIKLKKRQMSEDCVVLEKKVNERNRVIEERLRLREEKIEERFEELELKEKKVYEGFLELQRTLGLKKDDLVAKRRGLVFQEKKLMEQCQILEMKTEHMIKERKELGLREKELDESLKRVELMKKEVDERCGVVELKEKELNEGVCKFELKKKEVDERFREMRLMEERMIGSCKKVNLMKEDVEKKRKEVDERFRKVKLKEEEVIVCSKEVNLMKEEVRRKEKEVNEGFRRLELQEEQIMECRKGLEVIEKEIDERFRVIELKEKEMSEGLEDKRRNDSHSGLELIMKEIDERFEAVELKEKEMSEGFRDLELNKKKMNERYKRLELKENEVDECLEAMKLREKQVNDGVEALEVKVKQLEECSEGIELKQKKAVELIEKRFSEGLEALEGKAKELEECYKVMDGKEMELTGCRKSLESREQSLELREQSVVELQQALETKEKQISEQSQRLELKKMKLDKGFQALELKRKKIDKEYSVMKLRMKEINDRREAMEVKENQIRRRRRVLDWREQQINKCCKAPEPEDKLTQEETFPATIAVASSSTCLSDDIQSLCSNMNAKGLLSYLSKHVKEYDTLNDRILRSLRLAPDPAKLVLNVIQSLYELEFDVVPMNNRVGGCISLLVQLMKLSADISSHVKGEAREFTDIWRSLLKQINSPLENFGYLQYIASFKITETHNADELLSLFTNFCDDDEAYQPEQISCLCDALGLRRKMTDLIQSLILRNKKLQAVRYICTLKMESDFPVVPLLEAHLENIHKRINEILKIDNGNSTAKDDAAIVEVTALKEVLKCISIFKLESSYSSVSLELRIKQLQKERIESKTNVHLSSIKRCSESEKERIEEMPKSSNPSVLSSDTQFEKKRPANCEGSPKEAKHPRMHTKHPIQPPVHVRRHQFPVLLHRPLPLVSWPNYCMDPCRARYGVHYDSGTGIYGVGASTSIYDARNQAHRRMNNTMQ